MRFTKQFSYCLFAFYLLLSSCNKEPGTVDPTPDKLQLATARVGTVSILANNASVPSSESIVIGFNTGIDPVTNSAIRLVDELNVDISINYQNLDNNKLISITPITSLSEGDQLKLIISNQLKGISGETFEGIELNFEIEKKPLTIINLSVGSQEIKLNNRNQNIPVNPSFEIELSHEIPVSALQNNIQLVGDKNYSFTVDQAEGVNYTITPFDTLKDLIKFNILFLGKIGDDAGRGFESVSYPFYTALNPKPKFPIISDDELLTKVQEQTFKYFWDFGHPVSGLARERNTSGDIVTMGGSGFGLMAMIVGVERGFITRAEAIDRWKTIFDFLEIADRFHGAWPHWMNGVTGAVVPFSNDDNGADLVETAFLVQGMLTIRNYLNANVVAEKDLIDQITELWEDVEWSWFTQGGNKVLTWHWSPNFGWQKNLAIRGHNETQIIYTLAAASPTFPIDKETYINGYTRNGNFRNGNTYYGIELPAGFNRGGPLFFAHYSYLAMDPRNLQDEFVNYWDQNVAHSLINQAYCIDNPKNYVGYSEGCWGLTASDNDQGYSAHSPDNDRGVITPTAAISSIPYTPDESLEAIRHFYYNLGDRLWGEYGFYDAFNPTEGWVASSTLAIDQGPIICMIENYRTGLLWELYMADTDVKLGLDKLGFTY